MPPSRHCLARSSERLPLPAPSVSARRPARRAWVPPRPASPAGGPACQAPPDDPPSSPTWNLRRTVSASLRVSTSSHLSTCSLRVLSLASTLSILSSTRCPVSFSDSLIIWVLAQLGGSAWSAPGQG